jgi:hypothetical protein
LQGGYSTLCRTCAPEGAIPSRAAWVSENTFGRRDRGRRRDYDEG